MAEQRIRLSRHMRLRPSSLSSQPPGMSGTFFKQIRKQLGKNGTVRRRVKHEKGETHVHLIRIQKTGGTTFGERIMSRFCGGDSAWCLYLRHAEWQQATKDGHFGGTVLVWLRHPVERTISEFFFLRTADGRSCSRQPQWDFRNEGWLTEVQNEWNVPQALCDFLEGDRANPARNRQALYLLGFNRSSGVAPGAMYDWDGNRTALLDLAKAHLRKTLFGITDCFDVSTRVITQKLGWNTTEALALAATSAVRGEVGRNWRKTAVFDLSDTSYLHYLNPNLTEPVSTAWNHTRPPNTWRSLLPRKLVNYIENWNSVDMELYDYALQLFAERHNETCQ